MGRRRKGKNGAADDCMDCVGCADVGAGVHLLFPAAAAARGMRRTWPVRPSADLPGRGTSPVCVPPPARSRLAA